MTDQEIFSAAYAQARKDELDMTWALSSCGNIPKEFNRRQRDIWVRGYQLCKEDHNVLSYRNARGLPIDEVRAARYYA